jgi:DNA repair exonuclease SbcCD ATPase subunit/predicted phosphodiesterase
MIKTVIHLSDIHIRSGDLVQSRFYAYLHAFDNTAKLLQSRGYPKESVLVIITGDIFHVKNTADSTGIYLFNYLMDKLQCFCRQIILIYGNHDFKQHARDEPGILHSITMNKDILLLDDTGLHDIFNITFSLVAIKDTLLPNDTFGSHEVWPEFIKPTNKDNVKIALFHGDIYSKERTDWLLRSGCDVAMLGDIHIPDINVVNGFVYAYPGSLLQQNYGENLFGHGFVIWNISSDGIIPEHCVLPQSLEGQIYIKDVKTLDDILTNPLCPKLLRIRTEIVLPEQYNNIIIERCIKAPPANIEKIETKKYVSWLDYIKTKIEPESFSIPDDIFLPTLSIISDKINIRNSKLRLMLNSKDQPKEEHNVGITKLTFGWLFCYNDDNIIEFEDGNPIKIISGDNSAGKSSIFDIICLSIFSKQIESRKSDCYINSITPTTKCAWTRITIGSFILCREFIMKSPGKIEIKSKIMQNDTVILSGNPLCNEWVAKNIGTYENFLIMCMISQNNDYSFFKMSSKEQMGILDKMLNVEEMHKMLLAIQESIIAHDFIIKNLHTMKTIYEKNTTLYEILDLTEMHEKIAEEALNYDELVILQSDIKRVARQIRPCSPSNVCDLKEDVENEIIDIKYAIRECVADVKAPSPKKIDNGHARVLSLIDITTSCANCIAIRKLIQGEVNVEVDVNELPDLRQRLSLLENHIIYCNNAMISEELEQLQSKYDTIAIKITPGLQDKYIKLVKQNERNSCANETAQQNIITIREINEYISQYSIRIKLLEKIVSISKGYREWLYQEVVLPNLCKTVNNLIGNLINVPWTLTATICDNSLQWSVSNGIISSGINTCGGYREFIFGIAIRIAMAQYYHICYSQLFIDEGFISGSGLNLQEVPYFLNYIISNYSIEIILISHLPLLHNCGKPIKINTIMKNGVSSGVSHIRYTKESMNATESMNAKEGMNAKEIMICAGFLKSGKQCTAKPKMNGYCLRHYTK